MRLRPLGDHDRGLAFALVRFGLVWVVGGMLFAVLDPAVSEILTQYAALTTTQAASEGHGYLSDAWKFAPLWIVLIGMLQILAGATLERRAGGRV